MVGVVAPPDGVVVVFCGVVEGVVCVGVVVVLCGVVVGAAWAGVVGAELDGTVVVTVCVWVRVCDVLALCVLPPNRLVDWPPEMIERPATSSGTVRISAPRTNASRPVRSARRQCFGRRP